MGEDKEYLMAWDWEHAKKENEQGWWNTRIFQPGGASGRGKKLLNGLLI